LDNKFNSKGWIMQIISNEINIIEIGYFYNIETINKNNILKFNMKNGWYEIAGGNIEDKLFVTIQPVPLI
jgi:hypothetical protein